MCHIIIGLARTFIQDSLEDAVGMLLLQGGETSRG